MILRKKWKKARTVKKIKISKNHKKQSLKKPMKTNQKYTGEAILKNPVVIIV